MSDRRPPGAPDPFAGVEAAAGRGTRATVVAVVVSTILAAVKILAGVVGSSYALIADGVESMLDIVSSVIVWGSLRIAAWPPDDDYPFGYGRVEPLATLVIAAALLVAALGIALESVQEILTPHHAPAPFTLGVLVGVVVVKELLFRRLSRTGRSIGSHALQSDAWHHRSDALTSAAAFVGISVALVAGPGFESADDWAALFACGVIAYNGSRLFRTGFRDVLDAAAPGELEAHVRQVAAGVEGVHGIDKCRVRRAGLSSFVEIHVVVDGTLTVRRGHEIGHDVKDALLRSQLGLVDAMVHVEPAPLHRDT